MTGVIGCSRDDLAAGDTIQGPLGRVLTVVRAITFEEALESWLASGDGSVLLADPDEYWYEVEYTPYRGTPN
jgi:hypothetical protein